MDSKISELIEEFLISKDIEEGCSASTIKAYRYDLQKFISLTCDIEANSPFLTQKIRLFLKALKDKNYSKKGIARKIASLKSFFKFLQNNEIIEKNPMAQIKSPKVKVEESLPKFLKITDIKKIFDELLNRNKHSSNKAQLYYIIVRLLYSTMARVSELCNIRIRDVNFNENYIKLRGKGNKERIVPVDNKTIILIKEYLKNRLNCNTDDFLLLNSIDKKLTPRVVQNYIKHIKEICGFPDSEIITPHIFRHTGATHLRHSGMDISELQDILGHSNPTTTRIYVKNDIFKIKQSYNIMHPLAQNKNSDL